MEISIMKPTQLPIECKYHSGFYSKYLLLSSEEDNILLCKQCISQSKYRSLNLSNFQDIKSLFSQDENTILWKWPPLSDQSLLCKASEQFQNTAYEIQNYGEIISNYFDDIMKLVVDHIGKLKKDTLIKYNEFPEIQENFLKLYNQIAEKDKIKEILLNRGSNFDQVQSDIKEFIRLKESQKVESGEALKRVINLHKQFTKQLNQNKLQEQFQQITHIIENITYFPIRQDEFDIPIEPQINEQMQRQPEVSQQVQLLLDLIKNPFNNLSAEFEESITSKLINLTPCLNNLVINNVCQQNKVPIHKGQLSQEQIRLLDRLATKMSETVNHINLSKIKEDIFPNTKRIFEEVKQLYHFSNVLKFLQQLPVLECMDKKISFNVVDSFCFSPQQIQKKLFNWNKIVFTKLQSYQSNWENCIKSDRLEKDMTYKIQFEVTLSQQYSGVILGLLLNQSIKLANQRLCFKIDKNSSDQDYGIFIQKKGTQDNLKTHRIFELTVNLSRGRVELSDYPDFNNTLEINDTNKNNIKQLNDPFFIGFSIYDSHDSLQINNIEQIQTE